MNKINLLLVDDHQIFRDGIKIILQDKENVNLSAETADIEEALELLSKNNNINIIVSDIAIPEKDGLTFLRKAKTLYPHTCFLILSRFVEEKYALKAIEYGADGYLPKDVSIDELLLAIKTISEGDIYYHKSVADIIIKSLLNVKVNKIPRPNLSRSLTKREREILALVVSGINNAAIAEQLDISIRTVENHRANILRKVGAKNTAELVKFALQYQVLKESA